MSTHVEDTNTTENLIAAGKTLLKRLNEGQISPSAYDTAWVALIPNDSGTPLFPQCLTWIQENQLQDGSWGTATVDCLPDRLLCTLSCLIALKTWHLQLPHIVKAEAYLKKNLPNLSHTFCQTQDFDLLFPLLISKGQSLGLDIPVEIPIVQQFQQARQEKLSKLPFDSLYTTPTRFLGVLEGLADVIDCQSLLKFQSANGAFFNAPATTAFVYLQTKDERALAYLQDVVQQFGTYAPVRYPIDIQEKLFVINNIYYLQLERHFRDECTALLQEIKDSWTETGIGWSRYVPLPDLDSTAIAFKLLRLNGRSVSPDVFQHYYNGRTLFHYPGSGEPALDHLINLLDATQAQFYGETHLENLKTFTRQHLKQQTTSTMLSKATVLYNNLEALITDALEKRNFFKAPFLERQKNITLYQEITASNNFIDKVVYQLPNVNNVLFLKLAQQENTQLRQLFEEELDELQIWAKKFLDPALIIRVLPVHIMAYNSAWTPEQQATRIIFTKSSLFAFGLDDLLDETQLTEEKLIMIVQIFKNGRRDLIKSYPDRLYRKTLDNLYQIVEDLVDMAMQNQPESQRKPLRDIIDQTIDAQFEESSIKVQNENITLKQYTRFSGFSSYAPMVLAFSYYCLGPLPPNLTQTKQYQDMLHQSGKIVRVLNDIASYEREVGEGKISSVGIIMKEKGLSSQEAINYLYKHVYKKQIEELHQLARQPGPIPTPYSKLAYDMCRTTAWFYEDNDFHKYTINVLEFHTRRIRLRFIIQMGVRQLQKINEKVLSKPINKLRQTLGSI